MAIIGLVLLSGCGFSQKEEFGCITTPAGFTFSFPVDQWTEEKPTPTFVPADHTSWVLRYEDQSFGNPSQIIARGSDQIWILNEKLFLFNKKENRVVQYSIEHDGRQGTPQKLFLAKNNTLWAIGALSNDKGPLLSKYNDATDRFENVIDNQGLLSYADGVLGLQEGSKGQLWILIHGEGIFTFDPASLVAKEILPQELSDGTVITSLAVDADNNLWLGTSPNDRQDTLLFLDTKTMTMETIPLGINQIYPNNELLVDNLNRLWISDYAFWKIGMPLPTEDRSGLNLIVRSPVFITQRKPYVDYAWLRPKILMQDSDGYIWYTSFGLVKMNPDKGTWCKVLDSDSIATSITEDSEGNFWIVVNGKLYEHD